MHSLLLALPLLTFYCTFAEHVTNNGFQTLILNDVAFTGLPLGTVADIDEVLAPMGERATLVGRNAGVFTGRRCV